MNKWRGLLVASVLLVMMACGDDPGGLSASRPSPTTSEAAITPAEKPADYKGLWRLIEGTGPEGDVPIVKGWEITGHINDKAIYGDTGCNYYASPVTIEGGHLSFTGGGYRNEMGCSGPAPEDSYLAALYASTAIGRNGDLLVLSGPESRLVFKRTSPPPIRAIIDRRWQLEKVVATHPQPHKLSLRGELSLHKGGTFEGFAGCKQFSGNWIVEGDRILNTQTSYRGRCSQRELKLVAAVIDALGDGFTAQVNADRLTIFAARSRDRLLYRAFL